MHSKGLCASTRALKGKRMQINNEQLTINKLPPTGKYAVEGGVFRDDDDYYDSLSTSQWPPLSPPMRRINPLDLNFFVL